MLKEAPNAILVGGLALVGRGKRLWHTSDVTEKITVLIGNRYEHFEPSGESIVIDGRSLVVFRWSHNTYVAE